MTEELTDEGMEYLKLLDMSLAEVQNHPYFDGEDRDVVIAAINCEAKTIDIEEFEIARIFIEGVRWCKLKKDAGDEK